MVLAILTIIFAVIYTLGEERTGQAVGWGMGNGEWEIHIHASLVYIFVSRIASYSSQVRLSSLPGIPHMLVRVEAMRAHPDWLQLLISRLCAFEAAATYSRRLLFVRLCQPIAATQARPQGRRFKGPLF